MLGSKVGNQLRVTAIMDRYENFKMRDGETLEETYDRFIVINNEMKKNKLSRTEFDQRKVCEQSKSRVETICSLG